MNEKKERIERKERKNLGQIKKRTLKREKHCNISKFAQAVCLLLLLVYYLIREIYLSIYSSSLLLITHLNYHQVRICGLHWSISDSKPPQCSRSLFIIVAVFNNAIIWMVPTHFRIQIPSTLSSTSSAPITIVDCPLYIPQLSFEFLSYLLCDLPEQRFSYLACFPDY